MNVVGIICEYNPFHNGHIYHINKIKEQYNDSIIVLVMSSSFTERGIPSIMNKWDKTSIALKYGVDLVVELPFCFSTQSSDIFSYGAIKILKNLKVDTLVFGSESNNIELLKELANIQINNKEYDSLVKKYLDTGINYPTAMNKALKYLSDNEVTTSNDLLGLSYIKEILKQNANINPVSIKRTNNYLEEKLENNISSATSIRLAIKNNEDISKCVPKETIESINKGAVFLEDYFDLIKYKINTSDDLSKYLDVDEGIENRLTKYINEVSSLNELSEKIKSKRYTYNKINRMYTHILCNYTKEDNKDLDVKYIRILGFNNKGQSYLNKIKKEVELPILTTFNNLLDKEMQITKIYASVLDHDKASFLINREKDKIIIES